MNCPSRVDPQALERNGWNQSPDIDLPSLERNRQYKHHREHRAVSSGSAAAEESGNDEGAPQGGAEERKSVGGEAGGGGAGEESTGDGRGGRDTVGGGSPSGTLGFTRKMADTLCQTGRVLRKFTKFMGPGWMVAVAYIDPGNYATDIAAGSTYRFRLLVMILTSNIIAIFLQSLCVKLGSVTGLNLAENCKVNCPPWLNYFLFFFAEAGIIATDIAEVIGVAVALNLLTGLPLVGGCAVAIADVLVILFFYRPSGSMRALRYFEIFVGLLVLGVIICFCIQLSYIKVDSVGELFRGYLPSDVLIQRDGLLQACGILGATVMPHSLYLGSGLVQRRLFEFDKDNGMDPSAFRISGQASVDDDDSDVLKYRPSLAAIRSCLKYSIVELGLSLFTFALFVNSAILIVAGAALYDNAAATDASLFGIHDLLSESIGSAAGVIFALALLLSGISAGIVCTMAGQMVWLGQLRMPVKPWLQRLITRSIAITPSIIIAGAVGKEGVTLALEGTQIALSVILPFVSAPLIWFTCRARYMIVEDPANPDGANMKNHWVTATFAVLLWGLIVVMNVASWFLQIFG